MVIKGTSCAGARRLAAHLTRTDTNERAEVLEVRGVTTDDLRGALLEMEAVAAGGRSSKPFYHASINTRADERLTEEQRLHAIDLLETALGLSGQPRVVVVHLKDAREHCHCVWSRISVERMAAISDSHNYRKHEQVARELEREFGHARVQGAHVERGGKERPKRTPSHAEMLQAERTGLPVQTVKAAITDIWRRTDSGRAFAEALRDAGYRLACGSRRDFVVIDPRGGVHSLARRVEGAKAKDIRARMTDLDAAKLPTVGEARGFQRESADGISASASPARAKGRKTRTALPRLGRPAFPKQLLRYAPRRPSEGFRAFRHRSRTHLADAPYRTVRFEVRPSQFYASLKPTPNGGDAFRSRSAPVMRAVLPHHVPLTTGTELLRSEVPRPATFVANLAQSKAEDTERPYADHPYSEDNPELAQILSAIAEEVHRQCAALCQGISAQYAARKAVARRTLPKNQVAAALAALSAECQAMLAAARRRAKNELLGRSQMAKALYGRRRPQPAGKPKTERSPPQLT